MRPSRWMAPILAALIAGCADMPTPRLAPVAVMPGAASPLARTPGDLRAGEGAEAEALVLDLERLMALIEDCPTLRAEREKVRQETGSIIQASLGPNPVLGLEAEMIPFDDPSFGRSRNKVRVFQRIETAGKADARVSLAEAQRDVAEAAYFNQRAQLIADAVATLHAVVLTRRKIDVAESLARLRADILGLDGELNRLGRLPDEELVGSSLAASKADLRILGLREEESGLIAQLEALLGLPPGAIDTCRAEPPTLPDRDLSSATRAILSSNSDLVLLDRKLAATRADQQVQESKAWPDVSVGVGYSRGNEMGEERDDFFGLFLEVPLPFVDRNQGGRLRARTAAGQAVLALEAAAARALDEWEGLRRRSEILLASRTLYAERLLPDLERALAYAQTAVEQGRRLPQQSLRAALELEEARLALLDIDVQIARLAADMRFLTGEPQR